MINLQDIRYVRLGTRDLEGAVDYATKILGLQLVGREGKAAYFRSDKVEVRGDTRDHTLVYFEGDPSDHTIGFDLKDPADFDRVGDITRIARVRRERQVLRVGFFGHGARNQQVHAVGEHAISETGFEYGLDVL